MSKVKAFGVVGAGYGDEGKGLMTDWLASLHGGATVVRTNGGAQAGHTVVTPGGVRHVFHHVGSGALAGSPTHLSRFFVSNPVLFGREAAEVAAKGGNATVTADPRGLVTTPYDMMINQIVERARSGGRHGSCGIGFGETIERGLSAPHALTVADLRRPHLRSVLLRIRDEWAPSRLLALGLEDIPQRDRDLLANDAILDRFLMEAEAFADAVAVRDDASLGAGDVIFEGAQGLMLDQDYGAFPHVTRSNTGALNMAAVAREAGIGRIEVTYATRSYVTRHGAGPLAHEVDRLDFADVVDPTNVPNEWQGTIRFAPLDLDILSAAVRHDTARAEAEGVRIVPSVSVSCLDQIHAEAVVHVGGRRRTVPAEFLGSMVAAAVGIDNLVEARGPTRATVETAKNERARCLRQRPFDARGPLVTPLRSA